MPTHAQFTDRKTGDVVTLRDLDVTMCEHEGILPDEHRMCGLYDFVCMAGIGILTKLGGSEVTEETLKDYLVGNESFNDTDKAMLHYYLVENYIFTAWYTR